VKLEPDVVKIEDNENTSKVKSVPDTLRRQPEAPSRSKPQEEEKEQDEPSSFFDLNFKSLATDGQ